MSRPAGWLVALLLIATAVPPAQAQPLAELLREAMDHPRVAAREHGVAAAEAALDAETAGYLGGGELFASGTRFEDDRIVGPFVPYDFAALPADRQFAQYGIRYRLPVDVFGVIAAARERAARDLDAARLLRRQETVLNLHRVATAYADLKALHRQETALAKRGEALARTETRIRTQMELGQASKLDGRVVASEVAAHRAEAARLEGALDEARARLAEAVGREAEATADPIHVPDWSAAMPGETLPVQLADSRARAARADARTAARSLWPRLHLTAKASQLGGGGEHPDAWAVGIQATIPLDLSGHRKRAASAEQGRAAAAEARAAEREASSRIRALESAYRSARADAEALAEELALRRDVIALAEEKHRLGAMSLEDLLRHQRDWLAVESQAARARAAALAVWSSLQVLLGTDADAYIETAVSR